MAIATLAPPEARKTVATDDMLAQLAGDEIDRLLAEAENKPSITAADIKPTPTEPFPPSPASSVNEHGNAADAADNFRTVENSSIFSASDIQETVDRKTEADAAIDADFLNHSASQSEETAKAATPLESLPSNLPPSHPSSAMQAPTTIDKLESAVAAHASGRDTLIIRVLEWINSPLDSFPDSVRDKIGTVALVTLFNATMMLAYVFFIRKH